MKQYRIPNTDLDVSRLAYGTWHIGGTWDEAPVSAEIDQRTNKLINTAVEQGINFIDLADIYTKGKSDQTVGNALAASPGLRDKLVLQAKCGIVLGDDDNPGYYNFDYDHIVGALEGTLSRLQTDHVELLLLHRPDALCEPEEVARAFEHLHSSGKVRYFGVSNHNAGQIRLLQTYVDQMIVVNQVELNLLHNHMINDGVVFNNEGVHYAGSGGTLDYCRLNDIMIQAWSPVAGGRIFNPPADAPANIVAVAKEIDAQAIKHKTTAEAIAFAWLLRHPAGIQPIIGTLRPERIVTSCYADGVELSRLDWYRLFSAARGENVP